MFYDLFETFSCTDPSLCEEKAVLKNKVIRENLWLSIQKLLNFFDMYQHPENAGKFKRIKDINNI